MKLSDRQHTPVQIPSVQPGTQGGSVPAAPGKPQNAASHSEVERDLGNESGRSSQYPMASEQEVQTRHKRFISKFFKPRPPKSTPPPPPPKPTPPPPPPKPTPPPTPPKPTPPPTPPTPTPPPIKPTKPKPVGGPNGANDAVNNANTISSLHKTNAFKPISSNLAANARNSFISHSVNALVGLPFSVVEHMASKEIRDRIDAQAKMPGAEKKDAQGVTTTNDPAATEQQKLEARLESAEIKTELMSNSIISINGGGDSKAVGKNPNAATDVDSRLNALEGRMNTIENQMKDITKRYNLIYDPYVAPESSETPTAASRMETVEKRYKHMNQQLKLLITVQKSKMEDAE